MAIVLQDNVKIEAGKPNDYWYLNPATNAIWPDTATVNSTIPISYRSRRLVVQLPDGDYWYKDGVADINLIKKVSSTKKHFFEKYDRYDLVYSSLSFISQYDGRFEEFDITPDMDGYYHQMILANSDNGGNNNLIWGNNVAWLLNFTGTFPDGFCIRIALLTLGASKCNVSDKYLTSGKTFDFVYNQELNYWSIDELESIDAPSVSYLPMYTSSSSDRLLLTNSNHTYLFKIQSYTTANPKAFILPPTSVWKGRKITIFIDQDIPNNVGGGPFFYPTPYALCTGINNIIGVFTPVFTTYIDKTLIWVRVSNTTTGLVTLDAGAGSKKVYVSGIQAGPGAFAPGFIFQFHYDITLDSANGGWAFDKTISQVDTIEGENYWNFPYGVSGAKRGSYVVFESEGFGTIKISDMNIII